MDLDLLQEGSGGSSLSEGVVLKLWLHSKHPLWGDHGKHCFLFFPLLSCSPRSVTFWSPPPRRKPAPAALLSECQHSNRIDRLLLLWHASSPGFPENYQIGGKFEPSSQPYILTLLHFGAALPHLPSIWASWLLSTSQPLNPDLFFSRTSWAPGTALETLGFGVGPTRCLQSALSFVLF